MKHLSSIVLAVAVVAAGTLACFSDPTSSLRKGPSRIELTRSAIFLAVGDSASINAEVKDAQGNVYGAGDAAWSSVDQTVAVVRVDSIPIPGNAFSRAFIRAKKVGQTWVKVTASGITDSLRVTGM